MVMANKGAERCNVLRRVDNPSNPNDPPRYIPRRYHVIEVPLISTVRGRLFTIRIATDIYDSMD